MKIKTLYVNKDLEMGPYYEAWASPEKGAHFCAEGKTEKQAIAALRKVAKTKKNAALKEADYYDTILVHLKGWEG